MSTLGDFMRALHTNLCTEFYTKTNGATGTNAGTNAGSNTGTNAGTNADTAPYANTLYRYD